MRHNWLPLATLLAAGITGCSTGGDGTRVPAAAGTAGAPPAPAKAEIPPPARRADTTAATAPRAPTEERKTLESRVRTLEVEKPANGRR